MDLDKGKVLLFVNMTLEEEKAVETHSLLTNLNRILQRFNVGPSAGQFAVYAQFTHDVEGGETKLNKDIALELIKRGFLKQTFEPNNNNIRFLEKVRIDLNSNTFICFFQIDINGLEMHDLYRVLKRQSDLFNKRYGMALKIKEHNSKFLTNKYGEVKHYYAPQVEMAVIEADIKKLLLEEYSDTKFEKFINPSDESFQ